ncbi:hypothetical protein WDW89_00810 [Deltaproteobacteria bacterium TL4]
MMSSPYYTSINTNHRWQGDIYKSEDFGSSVPSSKIPLWMLVNRTCHLVESPSRSVKITHLVFCIVITLRDFIEASGSQKNLKNQISNIVKGKTENLMFLPVDAQYGVQEPLVADFNMIYSFDLTVCPTAEKKLTQLTSPFAEHLFQRFARWFYTVGFDDTELSGDDYIQNLVQLVKT